MDTLRRLNPAPVHESGQAMVELAIGLTVMLLVLLGILDFAPAVLRGAELNQAVREGAAYGRAAPNDAAGIRARVRLAVPRLGLTDADITVTCASGLDGTVVIPCSSAPIGGSVTVSARFTHQPFSRFITDAVGGPAIVLTRSATSEIY
jgi:Flp pilus assembly protein TadG